MTTRSALYEQIMNLISGLPEAEQMALLAELKGRLEIPKPTEKEHADFMAEIDKAYGIWADRTDLPEDSTEYVPRLREGWNERLKRLHPSDGD